VRSTKQISRLDDPTLVQFKADTIAAQGFLDEQKRMPILIRVIDQGPGVSKSDAKKLFQPFQQVNAAADKKQGGTGLGLALVRYLAREHKGIAWLEWSREGVGSCFSLLLPLEVSEESPEEENDVHDTAAASLFKGKLGKEPQQFARSNVEYQSLGLSQTDASVYGLRGLRRTSASKRMCAAPPRVMPSISDNQDNENAKAGSFISMDGGGIMGATIGPTNDSRRVHVPKLAWINGNTISDTSRASKVIDSEAGTGAFTGSGMLSP